ncbi:lactococcin 972 family bacteriocin [Bacillus sp. WLY-B-L8]|uniref:lactococcin 972 family bacteriocin n=1 Tax=Bacillus multifaciens TaxID=3068506 RepID=UPI002742026E|nr:lactococcin 972 family bacteriocin [Bacillus sp. WLY-B-L8]MDP7978826.1 lactococcin 972 family bacteriocin [Bacillus sp. WLY-B-L8]
MKKSMKKGIVGVIAAGMLAIPMASSTFAAEQSSGKSEIVYENDQLKASKTFDESSVKGVTSGAKDGGYWIRGKKGNQVYSSYKHYTKYGRASVVNGEGDYEDGGWKPKNQYSTASLPWTSAGTNKAYYDYK